MSLVQAVFVVFTAFAMHIVGANMVRPIFFLFFFSLLKRKKEAKKEKISPTLTCAAVYYTKGNAIFVTQNKNPPEGGTGGCCRRKTVLFSPLYRGERLSGEHAALRKRKKEAKKEKLSSTLTCAAVYRTKGSAIFVMQRGNSVAVLPSFPMFKTVLSFSLYNRYWKPMLLKG